MSQKWESNNCLESKIGGTFDRLFTLKILNINQNILINGAFCSLYKHK